MMKDDKYNIPLEDYVEDEEIVDERNFVLLEEEKKR